MEKLKTTLVIAMLLSATFMLISTCNVNASAANSSEALVWSGDVYSSGVPLTSPVLKIGKVYRIVASEMFWYDYPNSLMADAMYYTKLDAFPWANNFPAPGGHSFLQINGRDVYWGPFSNDNVGHEYSIMYIGRGSPLTFRIIDWVDRNYANNHCHLPVAIYQCIGLTPGYWKNHPSEWPTEYSTNDRLQSVFGPDAPDASLLQALQGGGGRGLDGSKQILARAATAALLNAAKFGDNYPYTVKQIEDIVSDQFSSGTRASMLVWATIFDIYNNLD